MWFKKHQGSEDEESLLPPSPSSTKSGVSELSIPSPAIWKRFPRLLLHAHYQLLLFTIPSFLRRSSGSTHSFSEKALSRQEPQKKHSTEYLDGVRGLASFIVFVLHWTHIQYPGVNSGWISPEKSSIWQLPIIRFVYSGAAMVSIFFVVSGYVLTHRFVQKMYRREFESLFTGLTSLTFRRALRLFLPALGSCILAYICASFKFISIPRKVGGKKFHHGPQALITYLDLESNPWTWDLYMKGFYNPQLWSIAVEYRGSMVVFLTVLAIARCRTSIRMALQAMMVAHSFGHKRWDIALFIAGMLVAEFDVFVNTSDSRKAFMQKKRIKAILVVVMIIGVWLSGFPRDHALESFGYTFARGQWPHTEYRRRFWMSIASILVVGPMPYLPFIQSFFNTKIIRYLGKISFALYLIHGLGNRTAGTWLLHFTWRILGKEGDWGFARSYVVSSLLYTPIVIWWSDMYWRAIDIPSTHFAKWLEGKCASTVSS